jgi:hypothetical protein
MVAPILDRSGQSRWEWRPAKAVRVGLAASVTERIARNGEDKAKRAVCHFV